MAEPGSRRYGRVASPLLILLTAGALAACGPRKASTTTKAPEEGARTAASEPTTSPGADDALAGEAAPPGWRRRVAPEYFFSVLVPVAGQHAVERSGREQGAAFHVELERASFHASVLVQDVGLTPTDNFIAYFDERVQWFRQSSGGEVVAQRDAPVRGYPGVGVDIRVPGDDGVFGMLHIRIVRAGIYHYELLVISPDGDSPRYEEFFDSFELAPELDREVYSQYPAGERDLVLAELHRERGEPAPALDYYSRAAESGAYEGPVLGAIHLSRGNALDRMGKASEAITAYDRAANLGISPLYVQARRGALLLSKQRFKAAFATFDAMLGGSAGGKPGTPTTDDGSLLAEAHRLRAIARYGSALAASDEPKRSFVGVATRTTAPGTAPASSKPARELPRGELERVLSDLDAAVRIEPMSTRGRAWRGVLRFERGDREGAREDLMRAGSAAPQQVGVLCRLLWRLGSRDAEIQARALVEWLEQHPPAALERHGYRAHVFQVLLAELWMIAGAPERASAAFERARALRPGLPALIHRHGSALDRQGAHAEARRAFERAHELAPDSLTYRNSLAWLLATSRTDSVRDGARAVELAAPLLDRDDLSASYVDTVAATFAEAGRFDEAADAQRRAMELLRVKGASDEQLEDYARRLQSYEADKPWRESAE